MKSAVVIDFLAVITAFVGFYAAKLWLQSSKVPIVPTWAKYGGIEQAGGEAQSNGGWIAGIIEASEEAARLNQRAARWTAVSVGLGAITTIIGAVLPYL
ncbi:hypothetical protein [Burkholderia gladioli]|uniref:hypothetical protein n=1 Tax=Burkholderia gladioli TaxID=28095 RepID=UPI00163F32E0|nr:hypothetical protein [Burkholderia gladioli]